MFSACLSLSSSVKGRGNKWCYFRSAKFHIKNNPYQSIPYKYNLFILKSFHSGVQLYLLLDSAFYTELIKQVGTFKSTGTGHLLQRQLNKQHLLHPPQKSTGKLPANVHIKRLWNAKFISSASGHSDQYMRKQSRTEYDVSTKSQVKWGQYKTVCLMLWCVRKSPLGIGLIVLVPFVLDHPVAADPHIWPRHLHSIQGNPWRENEEEKKKEIFFRETNTNDHISPG